MPIFKIWNATRNMKRMVVANTMDEFLRKGKEKLEIVGKNIQIVLNSDGTLIDEWEILETLTGEVLQLLKENEQWSDPSAAVPISAETNRKPKAVSSQPEQPSQIDLAASEPSAKPQDDSDTESQSGESSSECDAPSEQSHQSTDKSNSLAVPHSFELPEFSPCVMLLLKANDMENALPMLLKEAATYYFIKYPRLASSVHYHQIGKKLVEEFPCLKREGIRPWSFITKKLSSRIRQLRLKENKKFKTALSSLVDGLMEENNFALDFNPKAKSVSSQPYQVNPIREPMAKPQDDSDTEPQSGAEYDVPSEQPHQAIDKTNSLPEPLSFELPEFSPNVILLLKANKVENALPMLLKEAATYYFIKYPMLASRLHYQQIGKKLVDEFPCLKHEGIRPWSFITKKLSSRIRQLRIKENKKFKAAMSKLEDGIMMEDNFTAKSVSSQPYQVDLSIWEPTKKPQDDSDTEPQSDASSSECDAPSEQLHQSTDKTKSPSEPAGIELPELSPHTLMLLKANDVENALPKLLREAATYYFSKYPTLSSSVHYQQIGKTLVEEFPCLEHDGVRPWSFITTKLSSRIRQLRLKENRKIRPAAFTGKTIEENNFAAESNSKRKRASSQPEQSRQVDLAALESKAKLQDDSDTESQSSESSSEREVLSEQSHLSTDKAKSLPIPYTHSIELPEFSPNTLLLLKANDVESALPMLLREAALYYFFKYPTLASSADYQQIGKNLVEEFPCLKHEGVRPWSLITRKISSRIRQLRLKEKKLKAASSDQEGEPPVKIFKHSSAATGNAVDENSFKDGITGLQREWNGKRDMTKVKTLMADMRPNRCSWIRGKSVGEVLEAFPCMTDGSFIMEDFFHMLNGRFDNPQQAIADNSNILFSKIAMLEKESESNLEIAKSFEKKLAITKGKGVKSKTIMRVLEVESIEMYAAMLKKVLQVDDPREPPSLRILVSGGSPKLIYIVAEGNVIKCQSSDIFDALVEILAFYHVMDIAYPATFGQLLGFLQQTILNHPYTYFKGTNFQIYWKKLDSIK